MKELERQDLCFFCNNNVVVVGGSAAIHESEHWYVKKNDYPYKGSEGHYLVVSKKHVTRITDLPAEAWLDLQKIYIWIDQIAPAGYSSFVRMGDTAYTGATFNHLHFHAIWGIPKPEDWNGLEDNILVTLGHKKK